MENLRYLTDSYDPKIARIKEIGAPLNFIFITDQHYGIYPEGNPLNAVKSMGYILERCPEISFIVSGGDHGNDYDPDPAGLRLTQIDMMNAMCAHGIPVYPCIGNHDDGLGTRTYFGWDAGKGILPSEMHGIYMRYNPTEELYYFIDDEKHDYRYVFLNTSDVPYIFNGDGSYPYGFRVEVSNRQLDWLDKTALETDRRVIIFSHVPIYNPAIFGTEGTPECIMPYDDLFNGPRLRYIVDKHPNIVAAFAGHVHFDNLVYDWGFVSVTTLGALCQNWVENSAYRVGGTYTETAFDVVSVKGNMIYLTRFGAGNDRSAMMLR